ncbi:MAG: hypothetical protein ACEPO8_15630 [Rhodothermaceae bacterium]
MDEKFVLEIIGYIASGLVAVSLMMTSIIKLRVINLLGAIFFVAYGMLISAYPVALVNFIIVIINIVNLKKIFSEKEYFEILDLPSDSKFLSYFLNNYKPEIEKYIPEFNSEIKENSNIYIIMRNATPAGVFIGRQNNEQFFVDLDFVIPGYRDFKIGKMLFEEKKEIFTEKGINKIVSNPATEMHSAYLTKMGFVKNQDAFVLEVK